METHRARDGEVHMPGSLRDSSDRLISRWVRGEPGELAPELDPVLELVVASSPELKPVPVLELELGLVSFPGRYITRLKNV